jgi:DNA helicase-2/ATP-dependent DNA helicase PcrA
VDVEALLADLDPDQRRAVLSDGAPLCIVAPAGSGKTRVLTRRIARRIADGSADASHVLVITFTRRAAGELVRRLRVLGPRVTVTAGTFHGIAYRLARQRWDDIGRRAPALAPDRRRLVEEVLSGPSGRRPRPDVVREVTAEIDWARSQRLDPPAYVAAASSARRIALPAADVAAAYGAYEALKRKRRLVDFDDLLSQGIAELRRDPAYAAAMRWRFRHVFVDEFQDVNPLQHALLDAWVGGRDDLCVVGDPHQAIYGWTGADGRWLEDFAQHHPGATVVHLGRSHRSSPQIVNFGHAVLTGASDGAPIASRPDGAPPRAHRFPDAQAEAAAVPALARDARPPGGRWGAIAVLARTNAQLEPVAAALERAAIPFRSRVTGEEGAAVRALLGEVGRATERGTLRAWLDEHALGADALSAAVQGAVEDLLLQDPDASGADLRVWLTTGGRGDGPLFDGDDAVALSSFHAAKGLEWPTVIVVGAVPGLVPHSSARTPRALDEERRLFHVAVTRAQRDLIITWYGDEGSPWLAALDQASEAPSAPPPALDRSPAAARPDPVVQGLYAWRRQAARAARVEETTVLDDRTLAAIVAADPSTIDELADVPGFGPLMARRHGPRILAALAAGRASAAEPLPPAP